jgi:hypothetical protein
MPEPQNSYPTWLFVLGAAIKYWRLVVAAMTLAAIGGWGLTASIPKKHRTTARLLFLQADRGDVRFPEQTRVTYYPTESPALTSILQTEEYKENLEKAVKLHREVDEPGKDFELTSRWVGGYLAVNVLSEDPKLTMAVATAAPVVLARMAYKFRMLDDPDINDVPNDTEKRYQRVLRLLEPIPNPRKDPTSKISAVILFSTVTFILSGLAAAGWEWVTLDGGRTRQRITRLIDAVAPHRDG